MVLKISCHKPKKKKKKKMEGKKKEKKSKQKKTMAVRKKYSSKKAGKKTISKKPKLHLPLKSNFPEKKNPINFHYLFFKVGIGKVI